MSFIDGLRHERESSTTAYHQFLVKDSKNLQNVHAFFEGQNDVEFYMTFLRRQVSNKVMVHPYKCGNKKVVYETFSKVMSKTRNGKVLFFVDKDLSDILNENCIMAPNIYVTDYYSIENYLVCEEMLYCVWELFHFINVMLELSELHLEIFRNGLEHFYQLFLPIAAWGICLRRRGKHPNINNISFTKFFHLNSDLTLEQSEEVKQEGIIKLLEQVCGEETVVEWQEEQQSLIEKLSALPPKAYVQGKLELCFFLKFVEKLREIVNNNISSSGRIKANIQLSEDNAIGILGPRLLTPQSLDKFLQEHLST